MLTVYATNAVTVKHSVRIIPHLIRINLQYSEAKRNLTKVQTEDVYL